MMRYSVEPLDKIDESFTKDKTVVLAAVNQSGASLMHADDTMKKDRKISKKKIAVVVFIGYYQYRIGAVFIGFVGFYCAKNQ